MTVLKSSKKRKPTDTATMREVIRKLPTRDRSKVYATIARKEGRTKAMKSAALKAIVMEEKNGNLGEALRIADKFELKERGVEIARVFIEKSKNKQGQYASLESAYRVAKHWKLKEEAREVQKIAELRLINNSTSIIGPSGKLPCYETIYQLLIDFDLNDQMEKISKEIVRMYIAAGIPQHSLDIFKRAPQFPFSINFKDSISKNTAKEFFYLFVEKRYDRYAVECAELFNLKKELNALEEVSKLL